jgi:diguanylate cyclase (GGDEF)-like protein
MNLGLDLLNKTNKELKQALTHFVDSLPNSGPLAYQVNSLKEAFKSNDAIFTFAALVDQYTKMQQSIDDLSIKDRENDLNIFKSLLNQCADKNLSTSQTKKITEVLSKIKWEHPPYKIMVSAGKALEYFANELGELREESNVIVSTKQIATQETEVVDSDVFLASKRLIKEVTTISEQLTQTYPNDTCLSDILHDAAQVPDNNKGTFFKSVDLLERTTNHLSTLIHQERASTEEILNDIHANLVSVFKKTSIIDKLMDSAENNANQVQFNMLTEFKNMEVKANSIDTIVGMKEHIHDSVLLMSEILKDYAKSQNRTHKMNTKIINNLNNEIGSATNFIDKLENQLNAAKETNLTDELTAIGNRKGYVQTINKERNAWLTSQNSLILILIDVDRFKGINDNFGHSIGDQVLKSLVQIIKNNVRSSDYIARYGGDEFIIILPETDLNKAIDITKKIRSVVNSLKFELRKKSKVLKITCSYGISNFTDKTHNTIDVFNNTDGALYQAKENGRNAIVVFSEDKFITVAK